MRNTVNITHRVYNKRTRIKVSAIPFQTENASEFFVLKIGGVDHLIYTEATLARIRDEISQFLDMREAARPQKAAA